MVYKDEQKSEEEEKEMKKEEEKEMKKGEKREKLVEIQENGEQLMINLNEAKLMNEENWIETTNFFFPFSFVSAFLSSSIVSCISDSAISFPILQISSSVSSNSSSFLLFLLRKNLKKLKKKFSK